MRSIRPLVCTVILASGCTALPNFDQVSGVKPKTVVDVIECELYDLREKINRYCDERDRNSDRKRCERLETYKAVAELSLQVDSQMVLAPSFTHTDLVSKSLTRAFDWGLKFDGQAQRTYTQTITFEISALGRKLVKLPRSTPPAAGKAPQPQTEFCYTPLPRQKVCDEPLRRVSLNGKLGLEEVVEMAFNAIDPENDMGIASGSDAAPQGSSSGGTGNSPSGGSRPGSSTPDATQPTTRRPKQARPKECTKEQADQASSGGVSRVTTFESYFERPEIKQLMVKAAKAGGKKSGRGSGGSSAFGTSIEFSILLNVNSTGPTWTLAHFKGPGKLLTAQRTDTHTLNIGFSKTAEGADEQNRRTDAGVVRSKLKGIFNRQLLP